MIIPHIYWISVIGIIAYLLICNVKKRRITLDFKFFFTFGFLYYLLLPIGLALFGKNIAFMKYFEYAGKSISDTSDKMLIMLLISIDLFYICMMGLSRLHMKETSNLVSVTSSSLLQCSMFGTYVIFLIVLIPAFPLLGRGYIGSYMGGIRGRLTLVTQLVVITFLLFIEKRSKLSLSSLFFTLFAEAIVLTTGTRMEFITSVIGISLSVLHIKKIHSLKLSHTLLFIVILAGLMAFVGVIRSKWNLKSDLLAMVLFGEAMGSDYSLFSSLLYNDELPLIGNPFILILMLSNILPSGIVVNKSVFFEDLVYNAEFQFNNPMGGLSVHTSLMICFGIIGIPLFCLILSFLLRVIRRISCFAYYEAIGTCTFMLFRNGFDTVIVKNLIECCIMIPLSIFIIDGAFKGVQTIPKRKTRLFELGFLDNNDN